MFSKKQIIGIAVVVVLLAVILIESEKRENRRIKNMEEQIRVMRLHYQQLVAEEYDSCFPAFRF